MRYQTRRQMKATIAQLRTRVSKLSTSPRPASYEVERLKRYEAVLDKLWKRHSEPYASGQPGDWSYGQTWWCTACRTQWPCEVANLVLVAHGSHKLGPLRAPIVGETITPGAVETAPGSLMAVQGLVVPKTRAESAS